MDASKVIGYDGIFATRLRELMKNAKATQQDVAAAVGTTRQAISQYADGSVQPNIEKLYKIAEYFTVSADYLLGLSDVTTSNVDDKAINQMLGLSEKAIARLKKEVDITNEYLNNFRKSEKREAKPNERPYMVFDTISLLLEEPLRLYYNGVLEQLTQIFAHQHEKDPHTFFELAQVTAGPEGCFTRLVDIPNQLTPMTDSDVFAIRLLKLQQAITRYKNEFDESMSGVDNK
jgi:transcriptional regulator with XRE-family HTH domain